MFENVIAWAVLGLLFVLCLPLTGVKRLLLFVYGWALRLAMLGLIGGAAYLWFRPAQLPQEIPDTIRNFAWLKNVLPDPFTPLYGVWIAGLAGIVLLPLLAIIDICRSAVARHVEIESTGTTERRVEPARTGGLPPAPQPPIPTARYSRRAAADAMAAAGSR
jgi:hypothetical protein